MKDYIRHIAEEMGLKEGQVKAAADLLAEGATVPFIARYRKEATGNLDELEIIAVRDRLEELEKLEKRRAAVLHSLKERDLLTPGLEAAVGSALKLNELEDIYLPYRPKRKTRASAAREKGLLPLAEAIMDCRCGDPLTEAAGYVSQEKGVGSAEDALQGASDIIAEEVSDNAEIRGDLRRLFEARAELTSVVVKKKEAEAGKYRDYFDYRERLQNIPAHRFLAVTRGAEEGFLKKHALPERERALDIAEGIFLKRLAGCSSSCRSLISKAVEDAYDRLISPSLETEMLNEAKKKADTKAIQVFAGNVRNLLLAPPLGRKRMIALDPGLRTGCKLVVLSAEGALLEDDVIYPLEPHNKTEEAGLKIRKYADKYSIEAAAVGNGTGGREAAAFAREVLRDTGIPVELVNESGASVYSASETARSEFPDKDLTVRGAVSIGRRLMDPLAELVKIEPKSIGVGQYQHDVDQKLLKKSLDDVVVSCVNSVGADLNTASCELLAYVSGLNVTIARRLIKRRDTAPFTDINQLMEVSGIGDKAFQQSAGFLRVTGGDNPLDAGAVHPESYGIVKKMAGNSGCSLEELSGNAEIVDSLNPKDYITDKAGLPTINDIIMELKRPGRDPRPAFTAFSFNEEVNSMSDLSEGMVLDGIVTNVTAFGAFVDLGVHQDGLVHISEISNTFVKDPSDVLKVNQAVRVKILSVDEKRRRISLSMKEVK